MGTGGVWGGFPPTQTDFFFFFKQDLELKTGAVLVVVKLKTAFLNFFYKNFPLVFNGKQMFGP